MVGDGGFELAFEQRANYLFVRVSGINGRLDTTIAYWTAIAAEVRRRRPRCLMVHDEIFAREAGFQGRVFGNEEEAALWLRFGHA